MKGRMLEIKKRIEKGEYGIARRECLDYAKEIIDKVESKEMSVYEADEMFTEAFVQLDLEKLGEEVLTVFHKGMLLHDRGKPWGATIAEIKGEIGG